MLGEVYGDSEGFPAFNRIIVRQGINTGPWAPKRGKEQKMKRENGRIIFYSLAGVYLVYLAYNMIRDLGQVEGVEKIIMIIAAVVFAVFGAGLVIWGVRKGMEQMKNPSVEEAGEASEDTEEETEALQEKTDLEAALRETDKLESSEEK